MATTTEILAEIAAYKVAHGRPCPAKHLTDKFGADALPLIDQLKKDGKVQGKRGRTGGLFVPDTTASTTNDAPVEDADRTPADDIAAQFAELAEKLAAEGGATAAVV